MKKFIAILCFVLAGACLPAAFFLRAHFEDSVGVSVLAIVFLLAGRVLWAFVPDVMCPHCREKFIRWELVIQNEKRGVSGNCCINCVGATVMPIKMGKKGMAKIMKAVSTALFVLAVIGGLWGVILWGVHALIVALAVIVLAALSAYIGRAIYKPQVLCRSCGNKFPRGTPLDPEASSARHSCPECGSHNTRHTREFST